MEANFLNLIISWQQKTANSDYFISYVYLYLYVCFYIHSLAALLHMPVIFLITVSANHVALTPWIWGM